MPVFREREIDMVVWPWIKEIATHFERVEANLQQQTETGELNARINAVIANTDRLITDKKEEQARVLSLFKS